MKTDEFKILTKKTSGYYKEKGSKFIATAVIVSNANEVNEFLAAVKKEHPKSRHICFATKFLDDNNEIYSRVSDDGEPSGTAGLPILNVIQGYELINILVTVVRYFGGTKLGKSGLIKAYKESTDEALKEAETKTLFITKNYLMSFPYEMLSKIKYSLNRWDIAIHSEKFSQVVTLQIRIKESLEVHSVIKIKEHFVDPNQGKVMLKKLA